MPSSEEFYIGYFHQTSQDTRLGGLFWHGNSCGSYPAILSQSWHGVRAAEWGPVTYLWSVFTNGSRSQSPLVESWLMGTMDLTGQNSMPLFNTVSY